VLLLTRTSKNYEKIFNDLNNFSIIDDKWTSSLVFIGKNGPKYGYNTTFENYKKSYPDTAAMGKLSFDLLQLKKLSTEYYFVIGKWHFNVV
jgi:hypothetical protein